MKLTLLASLLFIASLAHAQKPADLPACATISKACEAAGFMPGEHKKDGKGLWVDCVGAIAHGKTVTGVSATQTDAKACQDAARAARQLKKSK